MQQRYKHPIEPDLVEFEAHGLPCVIKRMWAGHLCGYVLVPPGHPWHGNEPQAEVHGGVTFDGPARDFNFDDAEPNDKRGLADWWVVGFDCAHSGDLRPGDVDPNTEALRKHAREYLGLSLPEPRGTYRDLAYVRAQTEGLARQAVEAAAPCTSAGEHFGCEVAS